MKVQRKTRQMTTRKLRLKIKSRTVNDDFKLRIQNSDVLLSLIKNRLSLASGSWTLLN